MRRGVCFDLDGTLLVPHGDWPGWVSATATALGVGADARVRFRSALERATSIDAAVTLESACRDALAACGLREPTALADLAREACLDYGRGVRAHPAAAALLERLATAAAPIVVVTNGPVDMQTEALRASGLATYVRATIVSGAPDVAVRKPHPRVFWLALTAVRARPEDVLMIGDDLEADVRGAQRFGLATCWISGDRVDQPSDVPVGTMVVSDLAEAAAPLEAFLAG
ncbi:MAG: HAD family hydrolase [Trueperaceae bacterium]|nr:MAG: HAD family hydrolase [Trueperaceae bacterium]